MIRMTSALPSWVRGALPYALAIIFFAAWSNASVQQRSRDIWEPWQTRIASDPLGYYEYLPLLFTYGMRPEGMEPHLRDRLRESYIGVDEHHDRVVIQYTYVVALLELPFFGIAESIEGWGATDGLTETHARLIAIAGVFYWTTGLLLLFLALRRWKPLAWPSAFLVMIVCSFGTNLFYYAYRGPGFSHVYCFFLVCLALWAMITGMGGGGGHWRRLAFALSCALLVVARPLDIIAVGVLYAWHWSRVQDRRHWRELLLLQVGVLLLVAFPQMLYWHDTHGSWIYYSYGKQGFSNWNKPELYKVLLAPMSGLLPWSPVFLVLPFGVWSLWREQRTLAIALASGFTLLIYGCASWSTWSFGCSFGQRSLAQYSALLMVVLWHMFGEAARSPTWLRWLCITLLLLTCRTWYFMALEYQGCYFGDELDWHQWSELFAGAIK